MFDFKIQYSPPNEALKLEKDEISLRKIIKTISSPLERATSGGKLPVQTLPLSYIDGTISPSIHPPT
jgi:hypothetical protein